VFIANEGRVVSPSPPPAYQHPAEFVTLHSRMFCLQVGLSRPAIRHWGA